MSKIRVMSETLANKIAAGEVIEKCSSIVKELVENSIDAGAKHIKVKLVDGGITEIKITDDGCGMDKDDAVLSFSRHATSKIINDDDLYFIDTLGFRGEALASIASVSEISLCTGQGNIGTMVKMKGGKLISVESWEAYKGTIITVSNIFYNTPARLKFLKSPITECTNSVNLIERLALSHPEISFTLENNEKILVSTSGSDNLLKTIHEIFGLSISSRMLEVNGINDDYEIRGYISKSELLKNNKNYMITFVNGRYVKNYELNKMINDAYYTYKPDTQYPIVVLNVLTDQTLIDVNIHPTKQDIKFSKIDSLSSLVIETIKSVLYNNLLIKEIKNNDFEMHNDENTRVEQAVFNFAPKKEETIDNSIIIPDSNKEVESSYSNISNVSNSSISEIEENILPFEEKNEKVKTLELYPVGLALGTYIIAQNDLGIYLIDQHAAQERINYEKFFKAMKQKRVEVTDLLIPITIELSPSDFITIRNHMELLNNLGFRMIEFGINTFNVISHPNWLLKGYEEESIRKILDLIIAKGTFDPYKFNEHIAITLACKLSIKANYNISFDEMNSLLKQLVLCDNPYNCPHGRPTIISFTKYELEKMFKRVMN